MVADGDGGVFTYLYPSLQYVSYTPACATCTFVHVRGSCRNILGNLHIRGFPIAQCFTPISFVRAEYGMSLATG